MNFDLLKNFRELKPFIFYVVKFELPMKMFKMISQYYFWNFLNRYKTYFNLIKPQYVTLLSHSF